MNRTYAFQNTPRCSATSKRTRERCKAPVVRGWTVCRFHGARGGGPRGKRNGMFKHGLYTKEAVQERRLLQELFRQSRRMGNERISARVQEIVGRAAERAEINVERILWELAAIAFCSLAGWLPFYAPWR